MLGSIKLTNRILIINTAFLGDVILTAPLIRETKKCFPNYKIDIMVNPAAQTLLLENPYLEEIIVFDKRKDKIKNLIRLGFGKRNIYEIILLPHKSFTSSLLAYLMNAPIRVGFNKRAGKMSRFLYTKTGEYLQTSERERLLELLKPICNVKEFNSETEMFFSKEEEEKIDKKLQESGLDEKSYFTIAPGSVWGTKRWIPEYYAEAAETLTRKMPAVLIGGKDDSFLAPEIKGDNPRIIDMMGKLSLRESALFIKKAVLHIGGDSAPLHFANAVKTPVVSIWGPTVPRFGFAPYRENDIILEDKSLECRPCNIHGPMECPLKHHNCMRNITPEMVVQSAEKFL